MKILGLLLCLLSFSTLAQAQHAKHNMVMFGEKEVFLSHIVYKVPHNYQVILKVNLPEEVKDEYLRTRRAHPDNMLVFLLDHMDISRISTFPSISGTFLREDTAGVRTNLQTNVQIEKFDVIFFDKVPEDLRAPQTTPEFKPIPNHSRCTSRFSHNC